MKKSIPPGGTDFVPGLSPSRGLCPLHPSFRPAALWNRRFRQAVLSSPKSATLVLAVERGDGSRSTFKTPVWPSIHPQSSDNFLYAERLVKMLLWSKGGCRVIVGGPRAIGEHIKKVYSPRGRRAFDADFMATVFEKPFEVQVVDSNRIPPSLEKTATLGRHLDGCRIGFDLGASDRKVSAVINGRTVFSEEVVWDPGNQEDARYHTHEIMSGLHRAAARLPRLDAIGGSSAGVIIDSRVMAASLFRGIPKKLFKKTVTDIFRSMGQKWGVPFEFVNDGEVTAQAAAMSLGIHSVLGIALGSSQAAGYVTRNGKITNWLNELAFAPVDYHPEAPVDEWSGDAGCGVQYFSQVAVIRLADKAGVVFPENGTPAQKLKFVQELLAKGDGRARRVFETIGGYVGYGIAHYADFYDLKHVLILGRVTSGEAGNIILKNAQEVLVRDFPRVAQRVALHLPDENSRRIGQAIAAASLPAGKKSGRTPVLP
ncbi:MAG: ROK family protein [Candidatus Aminicenantes bacterium]|nr:ROK family protein [Candidatus Aminicenantes bacterium]